MISHIRRQKQKEEKGPFRQAAVDAAVGPLCDAGAGDEGHVRVQAVGEVLCGT